MVSETTPMASFLSLISVLSSLWIEPIRSFCACCSWSISFLNAAVRDDIRCCISSCCVLYPVCLRSTWATTSCKLFVSSVKRNSCSEHVLFKAFVFSVKCYIIFSDNCYNTCKCLPSVRQRSFAAWRVVMIIATIALLSVSLHLVTSPLSAQAVSSDMFQR